MTKQRQYISLTPLQWFRDTFVAPVAHISAEAVFAACRAEFTAAGYRPKRLTLVRRIAPRSFGAHKVPAILSRALGVCLHPSPVLLVMSSNYLVADVDIFDHAVGAGAFHARAGKMVTYDIMLTARQRGSRFFQLGWNASISLADGILTNHTEYLNLKLK